ncbi:protein CYPRO4-like [Nymphaea colorata]|nr:protein CYPRO4-like [Nymphaea colorata]
MGGSHSREGNLSDSEEEEEEEVESEEEQTGRREQLTPPHRTTSGSPSSSASLDEINATLKDLKLKYGNVPRAKNAVKLYLHIGGNTPNAKWIISEKFTAYAFVEENADLGEGSLKVKGEKKFQRKWVMKVGSKVRALVSPSMQLKMFDDQRRVDFVCDGVWALKFFSPEDYRVFLAEYQNCLFENLHEIEATNKDDIYGKDFRGWINPKEADDSMWEDAEENFKEAYTPVRDREDLLEELEEAANGGIQGIAMGALDYSFLVSDSGIEAVKNMNHGIHGKGVAVKFSDGKGKFSGLDTSSSFETPKKALLMRAETNMLLMNPAGEGKPHATGLHQLDIETGKVVTEWKFAKDNTEITMRDITNDSKGAQLDPSGSTFLGLDDRRLCRWDMRDRRGVVQQLDGPVLHWTDGHQFASNTKFMCFATTGDGCIVVGSADGKIRLYSDRSMRMAKTAFPGLGSPITHVDVTYDGKWVLGTTDTYLILICTLFTDKDGRTKTGFTGRMGNKIAAPRLLKLTPLDSHLAGENNKFHGGQFSWITESGKQERHLVATVGKFSIIWNFQQVKNSAHECYRNQEGLKSCYCYKIVLKDESIVDSRFMHDNFAASRSPEAPLVVATPKKVSSFSMANRR